jgi:hypothetical protein
MYSSEDDDGSRRASFAHHLSVRTLRWPTDPGQAGARADRFAVSVGEDPVLRLDVVGVEPPFELLSVAELEDAHHGSLHVDSGPSRTHDAQRAHVLVIAEYAAMREASVSWSPARKASAVRRYAIAFGCSVLMPRTIERPRRGAG